MSRKYRLRGDGIIVGNGNVQYVNKSTRHYHGGGRSDNDGAGAVVLALGAGAMIALWAFVKNLPDIYAYMRLAAMVSLVPFAIAAAVAWVNDTTDDSILSFGIVSVVLAVGVALITQYGERTLSSELVEIARQYPWFKFWESLSDFGKSVVFRTAGSVLFLGISVLVNILAGLQCVSRQLAYSYEEGLWSWIEDATTVAQPGISIGFGGTSLLVSAGLLWSLGL